MGRHGEPYTAEQAFALVKAIKSGLIEAPEGGADSLLDFIKPWEPLPGMQIETFPEVCAWPEMADAFLKSL